MRQFSPVLSVSKWSAGFHRPTSVAAISFRSPSFQAAGYATGAVVSAFVLDRSWGLARGFDFYDDAFSAEAFKQKTSAWWTVAPTTA